MTPKGKTILIGGLIAATTVGTLTAILVPILNEKFSNDNKKAGYYKSLVAEIVAAKDKQVAKNKTMELYGLEVKKDEDIDTLTDAIKDRYVAATVLGGYIFDNKDSYQISIYEGEDSNALKQLLLVFKLKSNENVSKDDKYSDWPANKIDAAQDEFAFLYTIFEDKFIHGAFNQGRSFSNSKELTKGFKVKEYKMLELFFAFKEAIPNKGAFSNYNANKDENSDALRAIKKYIISLVSGTTIIEGDLDAHIKFTKEDDLKASGDFVPGTITFNYKTYKDTKNVNFSHIKDYKIKIKDGSEFKTADEIKIADIEFDGKTPTGITIGSVKVSTKQTDGSGVKVIFKAVEGVTPLVKFLELGGFATYKDKAWEIINPINANGFDGIKNSKILPSAYDNKAAILGIIHAKFETDFTDVSLRNKIKDAVSTSNIKLVPNNVNGSLKIVIENIGSSSKEFTISGFLTQNQVDDVNSIQAIIKAITGVNKTSDVAISLVVANTPFDVAAFKALGGTDKIFPSITKGTTLTYAHGGITIDGTLVVTVTIAKGAATATATFTVSVTGIDVAKKNKIQTDNLQALKTQLTGGNVINDADKAGVIAVRINNALSLKTETGIDLTRLAATSTYVISASGAKDTGVITVSVIMTTRGATVPKSPQVAHNINHKSDTEVQNNTDAGSIKTIIEAITGVKRTSNVAISLVAADTPFDEAVFKALGGTAGTFPGNTRGTILTYSHRGITSDGDLTVTVKIVKGTARVTATFTVSVTGIDVAKKNKIQTDNLQALKTQLTAGIVTNDADKAGVIAVRINNALSLKTETGIDLTRLAATSTYVISASGAKDTGVITISVIMTTRGATVPKSPQVAHNINHKSDTEVQNNTDAGSIKTIIEAITGVKRTSNVAISLVAADTPFDEAVFKALGGTAGTFLGNTRGTILTYAHGGITSDGDLTVTVKIVKGAARATATFTVSVTGIDAAKKDKIQTDNLQALKTQLTGGNVINDADKVRVIATRIKNAISLKKETGIDLTGLAATSTYVISANGDKDTGVITISVIMTTSGATVLNSVAVAHTINHKSDATIDTEVQNSLDKVDVDNVKVLIEAISGVKKTSSVDIPVVAANTPFDVAAFKALGGTAGTFPGNTRGTILTYSHGGITIDGDLTVTVKIVKGTARVTATFTVSVAGIDVAKQNEIQKTNLEALKTKLQTGKAINSPVKVSTIAARIKDAISLKKETGIDLTGLAATSTYVISAELDDSSGIIRIQVEMKTLGAFVSTSKVIVHDITYQYKSFNLSSKIIAIYNNVAPELNGYYKSQTYYWSGNHMFKKTNKFLILQNLAIHEKYYKIEISYENTKNLPQDGSSRLTHLEDKTIVYKPKRIVYIAFLVAKPATKIIATPVTQLITINFKNKNEQDVVLVLDLKKADRLFRINANVKNVTNPGDKDDIIIKLTPQVILKAEYDKWTITKNAVQALAINYFDSFYSTVELPSVASKKVTKAKLIEALNKQLTIANGKLIVVSDITIEPNDLEGKIVLTIRNHGKDKVFTKTGLSKG